MRNFIDSIPHELPANIIAPVMVESVGYKDFSLAIYVGRRRPPLSFARLTLHDNGDVELLKTRFLSTHVQESAWRGLVRTFGGRDDLPIDSLTVSIIESENSNAACD